MRIVGGWIIHGRKCPRGCTGGFKRKEDGSSPTVGAALNLITVVVVVYLLAVTGLE